MRRGSWILLVAALAAPPAAARAQIGELQIGVVGSYGTAASARGGAGLVVGVATGRLAYVGVRWTSFAGTSTTDTAGTAVRNRTQLYAVEVGAQFPSGPVEIIVGASGGFVRYAQRARTAAGPGSGTFTATEFLLAPSLSVEIYVAGVGLIPGVQYCLSGNPDLPWPVHHRGAIGSVRLVVPIELRRIRR